MWNYYISSVVVLVILLGCSPSSTDPDPTSRIHKNYSSGGYGSALADSAAAATSTNWAIIIGINDYSGKWLPLRTAVNGAFSLRNMLRDEFGYPEKNIRLLLNQDSAAISNEIKELLSDDKISPNDSILFYFAGHGTRDGLLATVESQENGHLSNGISVTDVRDWLRDSPFLKRAVILDSCYSGNIFERILPSPKSADFSNTFIGLTAARSPDLAFDGEDDSDLSPFTAILLDVLKERTNSERQGHLFNFKRLADEVKSRVVTATKGDQTPQWGFLGSGLGDFEFRETFPRLIPIEAERLAKEREERMAQTQRLIVASKGCRHEHPQRSLLLAVEAINIMFQDQGVVVPEAHQNLRDALTDIRGIPLVGHQGKVQCCAVGMDGRWLYTGGDHRDQTVRAWDLTNFGSPSIVLVKHEGAVDDIAISPNGSLLATASEDGSVRIVQLDGKMPSAVSTKHTRLHESWVTNVAFSPDNKWLASASLDGIIRLWAISDGRIPESPVLLKMDSGDRWVIERMEFTHDSKFLISGTADKTVGVWALDKIGIGLSTPDHVVLSGQKARITSLAISPDSQWFATGDTEGQIRLCNLNASDPESTATLLEEHEGSINELAFTRDGNRLISVSSDTTIKIWNVGARRLEKTMTGHLGSVSCLAISRTGEYLATGSTDQTVRIWPLASTSSGPESLILRGHEGPVSCVCFSRDGESLFSAGSDRTIRYWPHVDCLATGASVLSHEHFRRGEFALSSPSGRWFIKGHCRGNTATIQRLINDTVESQQDFVIDKPVRAKFSPDEHWLVISRDNGPPILFDLSHDLPLADGKQLGGLHRSGSSTIAFSPDSHWLVSTWKERPKARAVIHDLSAIDPATRFSTLELSWYQQWNIEISRDSGCIVAHDSSENAARLWSLNDLSADPLVLKGVPNNNAHWDFLQRRWLLAWHSDGTILVWDVMADDIVASTFVLSRPEETVVTAAISSDDHWLAIATGDSLATQHLISIYDISTGRVLGNAHRLPDHTSEVICIAFDQEGNRMLSSSYDNTIRLWDLKSPDIRASCKVLQDSDTPESIRFTSRWKWLISNSRDHPPRLWHLESINAFPQPATFADYDWLDVRPSEPERIVCRKDETVEFQPLHIQELVNVAHRIAGRQLTAEETTLFLANHSTGAK